MGNSVSPFALENETGYQQWRTEKLRLRRALPADRVFELAGGEVNPADWPLLAEQLMAHGFFIWRNDSLLHDRDLLLVNHQFGLHRVDANLGAGEHAVTHLQVVSADDQRARYIPYSDRGLNWHTDGYYNPVEQRIRSFCLYCVNPADEGGENFLFDHELLYILIRDHNPELIAALMAQDALTIPENEKDGQLLRQEERGPVLSIGLNPDRLHMRYSARPRNIVWKQQQELRQALELIRELLADHEGRVVLKMQTGQAVLTNNILHGRASFADGNKPRLMYRARYYDEIQLQDVAAPRAV